MNFYTHWDVLDATPIRTEYRTPLGVRRFKYFAALGFLIFAIAAPFSIAFGNTWAWSIATMGGVFWVGFGTAYRKNMIGPKQH